MATVPPLPQAFLSQSGAPGAGAHDGPRAERKEMRVLGPPRPRAPGDGTLSPPPESQSCPLRAEPPQFPPAVPQLCLHPAAPSPWSPGAAERLLGSARGVLPPEEPVCCPPGSSVPGQRWGAVATPHGKRHPPAPRFLYLFPFGVASRGAGQGPGFESGSSVLLLSV